MTPCTPRGPRARSALAPLAGLVALLAGCGGGGSPGAQDVVTVTVTPRVTATGAPRTTPPRTTSAAPTSDVVGRHFDLGTVVQLAGAGAGLVVVLDRWTAKGVKDQVIAAQGLPVGVYSDARFENLNTRLHYRIPVSPTATFTYNHCVSVDQPMQSRSASLAELARLGPTENVLVVTLDAKGRLTHAENEPGC